MSKMHEINKLKVNIKGYSNNKIEEIARDIVPTVIEEYFNKFDVTNKDVLIDKIAFDLGTIKSSNFLEEIKVRLSYLLQTELHKFFETPGIEKQLEQKLMSTEADAFINYVEKGYANYQDKSLEGIFQQLLNERISLLKNMIQQLGTSPDAMQRLYLQISYESWEKYWQKIYPKHYKEIHSTVGKILKDANAVSNRHTQKGSLKEFLQKMVFKFMNGQWDGGASLAFIELLKVHIDEFKAFESDIKAAAFPYLDELSARSFTQKTHSRKSNYFEQSVEQNILKLITSGQELTIADYAKIATINEKEWPVMLERIAVEFSYLEQPLEKLKVVLTQKQYAFFIEKIIEHGRTTQARKLGKLNYFKALLKDVFAQNIWLINQINLDQYTRSSEKQQLKNTVSGYLQLIAAQKQLDIKEVLNKIARRIAHSYHKEAIELQQVTSEIYKEISITEKQNYKANQGMEAFIDFLKSGIWLSEHTTPQEVLAKLLAENTEHLILELKRHLHIQSVWIRLIYQTPLETLHPLFELVFKQDKHFQLLIKALEQVEDSELHKVQQRKLYELFIRTNAILSKETELTFEPLFHKFIEESLRKSNDTHLDKSDLSTISIIELLNFHLKNNAKKEPPQEEQLQFIVKVLAKQPHYLTVIITDQQITVSNWKIFLSSFDKKQLSIIMEAFTFILKGGITWMPSFINFYEKNKASIILKKSDIIQLILFLVSFDEEDQLNFIRLFSTALEAKNKSLKDEFYKHTPNLDTAVPPPLINIIDNFSKIALSESDQVANALKKLLEQLRKAGISLTSSQINNILFDIIPFLTTAIATKQLFLERLLETSPHYRVSIESIESAELVQKTNKPSPLSFSKLVQHAIELGRLTFQPTFKDQSSFEKYFLTALQHSKELKNLLYVSNMVHLLGFISQLSSEAKQSLEQHIINKHLTDTIFKIRDQLVKENTQEKHNIIDHTIAYGLKHQSFRGDRYLQYIEAKLTSVRLAKITPRLQEELLSKEFSPTVYVESLLHYLSYGKYTYLELEQDGIVHGIEKVITYWSEEFIRQLKNSFDSQLLIEKLIAKIPENNLLRTFSLLIGISENLITHIIQQVGKQLDVPENTIFISWLSHSLSTHSSQNKIDLINTIIFQIQEKQQKKKGSAIEKIKWDISIIAPFPPDLIKINYVKEDQRKYNFISLFEEITKIGVAPNWLNLQSNSDLAVLIQFVSKELPREVKELFKIHLTNTDQVSNLVQTLGRENIIGILKQIDEEAYRHLNSTIKSLNRIHQSLGNAHALDNYFFTSYLTHYYTLGKTYNTLLPIAIMDQLMVDFSLSKTDYKALIQKSKSKIAKKYLQRDSSLSLSIKTRSTLYQIDLIIFLIIEHKMPWWAREDDIISGQKRERYLSDLIQNVLQSDPKEFISLLMRKSNHQQILQELIPLITRQQFDKVLLVLAPDFGGFVVSLDLLVNRAKLTIKKTDWFVFILQFLSERNTFSPSVFVEHALLKLSDLANKTQEKVRGILKGIALKAIKDGEMRFLPFNDLLAEKETLKKKEFQITTADTFERYDFIDTVLYYIRSGSIPYSNSFKIAGYYHLINALKRQLQFGHNDLSLAITHELTEEKVRVRLIKQEQIVFLRLLSQILIPQEFDSLFSYQNQIFPVLKQQWSTTTTLLEEIFYLKLFEQIASKQNKGIIAKDFILSFITFAGLELKREVHFKRKELSKLNVSNDLINILTSKTGTIEESPKVKQPPIDIQLLQQEENFTVDHRVLVKNAGLIISWPYLTRYFDLLGMIEDNKFRTEAEAVRGVHLLQYIATGSTLAPEHELLLNKVLCGLKVATPVPLEVELSEKEIETTKMMLNGLLQNWDKIKSSSIEALREGFLNRDGYILEKEKTWELKVEKKTIDILMENIPWTIGTVKLPWMEKRISVEWL
jgi:hypothetical protein